MICETFHLVFLFKVTTKDTAHFYEKVKWVSHTVSFTPSPSKRPLTPPTFIQPHVEETFNESAAAASTEDSMWKPADTGMPAAYRRATNSSVTELEMALRAPAQKMVVRKNDDPVAVGGGTKTEARQLEGKHGVYLDTKEVYFPSVETGNDFLDNKLRSALLLFGHLS